jgi:hypothetical protein
MPNWTPSSDLSSFYAGRMAPPIRLPDGTYIPAPNVMSVEDMYKGIYPPSVPSPPSPPLIARSVNTVPIDPMTGNPVVGSSSGPGFTAPTMAATRTEQAGIRPALTAGTQPAGTALMPPGVRPASVDRAFAQLGIQPSGGLGRGQPTRTAQVADPFGTYVKGGYQDRLPANDGGEAGFLSTFYPEKTNPAVDAIDITVNGGAPMPPMPRMRPIPPAQIPLTAVAPPSVPSPRNAGSYTIQKGDTLGSLAKRFNTTVSQLANANNIANPNKIRAGATLNLGYLAPPVPRMPPAALGRGYAQPSQNRPRETFDQIWAEARG